MAYDISEIKKLPLQDKLQIIDELWETIESDELTEADHYDEEPEVLALLQERAEKYERGEGVFHTADEAKKIVYKRLEGFRKKRND